MNDKIFLYGAPGSGKTTLGRVLSSALKLDFIDLDEFIERRNSCSVSEIFERFGEGYFRNLEESCLKEICSMDSRMVVSLGGGTLLNESCRAICEDLGGILLIETPPPEELEKRLANALSQRPLGNKAAERASYYASFPNRISATFSLPDSLVLVGESIAKAFLRENIVVDETVKSLHPGLPGEIVAVLPSGEEHKNLDTVQMLWSKFNSHLISRSNLISAVGGGVALDLTGFAAATWMRGIDWMNFPTTLLSMVDASTGGKTGCDLPEGKNLVGAFHSPRLVVVDTVFLETLSDEHIKQGLAEMVKHEIISGQRHLTGSARPNADQIAKSLKVKVDIVNSDPLEKTGSRALLNCGHTVGHAIEVLSNFQIPHGLAVAIGCVNEAKIAKTLGLASESFIEELEERFAGLGIDTSLPPGIDKVALRKSMLNDKKRTGKSVGFALPCSWGDVRIVNINPTEMEEW